MKSKLGLITTMSTFFLYWKRVELAKIQHFRCETLKPFFSKQAWDSYYHGISAATEGGIVDANHMANWRGSKIRKNCKRNL